MSSTERRDCSCDWERLTGGLYSGGASSGETGKEEVGKDNVHISEELAVHG